jgi:alpha-N-acetylglucosaminidase
MSRADDYLLEPTDPLFTQIGSQFYQVLIQEFGTDHFYNMDMFNEMDPSSNDPTYLIAANRAIYSAMSNVDASGVYVMQGWLFVNSAGFWGPDQVQAYLSAVPDDNMLILDLYTDSDPTWKRLDSYYGKGYANTASTLHSVCIQY